MHINVHCPKCSRRYQLNPEMNGQRMRCPNPICREIFEVREADTPTDASRSNGDAPPTEEKPDPGRRPTQPPEKEYVVGSIGELVPFVTSEAVEEEAPEVPAIAPPPVRRGKASAPVSEVVPLLPAQPAAEEKPAPPAEPPKPLARRKPAETISKTPAAEAPTVVPPPESPSWQQAPPPVRRSGTSSTPALPVRAKAPMPPPEPAPAKAEAPPEPKPAAPPPPPAAAEAPREVAPGNFTPPPVRALKQDKSKETLKPGDPKAPRPTPPVAEALRPETIKAATPLTVNPPLSLEPPPQEMAAGSWTAPPVRRAGAETPRLDATEPKPEWPAPSTATATEPEAVPAPRKRSRAKIWMGLMLIIVGGVIGGGIYLGTGVGIAREEDLVRQAKEAYEEGRYADSNKKWETVLKNFPDSESVPEYRFWKDLCLARLQIKIIDADADNGLELLRRCVANHERFVTQYRTDIWQGYHDLLELKYLPPLEQPVTDENYKQLEAAHKKTEAVRAESEVYAREGSEEVKKRLDKVKFTLIDYEMVRDALANLEKLKKRKPLTLEDIGRARKKYADLGIDRRPKLAPLWPELEQLALLEGNPYDQNRNPPRLLPIPQESAESILVTPRVDAGNGVVAGDGVVFALARGVLYALAEKDGRVLWADRVGIDIATLPVRLPRDEANPRELVLVLSSDTNTLTARDALTGEAHWQYNLGAPCLGRPVLYGRRAFVAVPHTVVGEDGKLREEGRVHEIEIVKGHVLGQYRLTLPPSGSGARQEGTSLLYFPADSGYLYVLDVDKHQCVGMLKTGHPSGSLRGEPILVSDYPPIPPGPTGSPPRFLILAQADGLDAMRLRAYRLPIEKMSHAPPEAPELPPMRGWSWFPPHCDGEKIALATDVGLLGLFGINQFNNKDAPLFPLLPRELNVGGDSRQPGRAQVVHAAENDFWVLAQGQLQHWRMGLGADGLKVAPLWPQALSLGSPLHAGQVNEARDTLFVVTRSAERQACLATAVDAATGKVRWQVQLGLNSQGDPRLLGERVAVLDQSGSLFTFDPKKPKQPLIAPRDETAGGASWLLPGTDGSSLFALTFPGAGKLALRRHGPPTKNPKDNDRKLYSGLSFPLEGTPALGESSLVLPLADGVLAQVSRNEKPASADKPGGVYRGMTWRADHADPGAIGHVVPLGGDNFLVTDGSKGLKRLAWPVGKGWKTEEKWRELENRIVAAPLVLPDDRVCVGDSAGNLVLLQGDKLKEIRRWAADGKITAGPFQRGANVGCVIDRRRVVWLDPEKDGALWTATIPGDGIVGQPQRVGDWVIVADLSGKFLALDAKTGKPKGKGYTLQASVAPAAAPVACGGDNVFAPLTDGTVLLLTLDQLIK